MIGLNYKNEKFHPVPQFSNYNQTQISSNNNPLYYQRSNNYYQPPNRKPEQLVSKHDFNSYDRIRNNHYIADQTTRENLKFFENFGVSNNILNVNIGKNNYKMMLIIFIILTLGIGYLIYNWKFNNIKSE